MDVRTESVPMANTTFFFDLLQAIHSASGNSTHSLNQSETENLQLLLLKVMKDARKRMNRSLSLSTCHYCEGDFREVIQAYNSIHVYVSLLVCTIGVIANCLNVAVLTRKDMAAANFNRLLKWLAVADVIVMLEYVPFSIYSNLILPQTLDFPYSWALYLLFHMHFGQIMHTASICLTLTLAVWRYLTIKYSNRSHILCTERRCSIAILTSFTLPLIFCVPSFMMFKINTINRTTGTAYYVDLQVEGRLYQANFWVHGIIMKLLPCSILTVMSIWLIRALYSANRHQKNLRNNSGCLTVEKRVERQMKADKRTDRTTRMLLAVLLFFLVTELPHGILGLMSGLLGWCFFTRCYLLFGELMDFLVLLNGAINFALYCLMSRQFRQNFRQLISQFKLNVIKK